MPGIQQAGIHQSESLLQIEVKEKKDEDELTFQVNNLIPLIPDLLIQ